jgi:chromosomal replication initiation ATPase DnaA
LPDGYALSLLDRNSIFKQGFEQQGDPPTEILKPRPMPDALIQAVSDEFGCGMETILRKGKKRNLARDVAIYLCRELTGETSVALGQRFDISGAGIASRHDQIAKKYETDRKFKGREDRIRRKILNI